MKYLNLLSIFSLILISLEIRASEEISYQNKFFSSINNYQFIYQDQFTKEVIKIKKCNKKILTSVFHLFPYKEKPKLNIKTVKSTKIQFKRGKKIIKVPIGSKTHHNLESIDKKIQGYISRARSRCIK